MNTLPVVYGSEYLTYDFGPSHPFTPDRWLALRDLLGQSSLPIEWKAPKEATDEQIGRIHSSEFMTAVKAASEGVTFLHPGFFGLATGDVPTFLGMHEASAWVAGGSRLAGHFVASGASDRVLQLSGGLHHAMSNRASGFCVYNDVAILIDDLLQAGKRVAYIDIDVHHGDGVQAIFYEHPDVLTVSLHESGHYLFPGTGFVNETGAGNGMGTSINVPLYPGTTDESYLESFDAVVPDVVRRFSPDVIVLQSGADAHAIDPLAHLALTTHAYERLFDRIIQLSVECASGRLVATLGGGYAFDITLRIWSMLAYKLAGDVVPDRLPAHWMERWRAHLTRPLWNQWHDHIPPTDDSGAALAQGRNRETVKMLLVQLQSLS